jgi:hypothetical protein
MAGAARRVAVCRRHASARTCGPRFYDRPSAPRSPIHSPFRSTRSRLRLSLWKPQREHLAAAPRRSPAGALSRWWTTSIRFRALLGIAKPSRRFPCAAVTGVGVATVRPRRCSPASAAATARVQPCLHLSHQRVRLVVGRRCVPLAPPETSPPARKPAAELLPCPCPADGWGQGAHGSATLAPLWVREPGCA